VLSALEPPPVGLAILHRKPQLFWCLNAYTEDQVILLERMTRMKLSKNVWRVIFALLAVMFLAVGCDTWVRAEGEGWSFEAKASATAEIKNR
jgi:hypothetical protein